MKTGSKKVTRKCCYLCERPTAPMRTEWSLSSSISRRALLKALPVAVMAASRVRGEEPSPDPWPGNRLLEPAALSELLKPSEMSPMIISVAFPVLYRQRRITGARLAGPGSKPEGIAKLKEAVSQQRKDSKIVLYCGCCPMEHCPNIRPAYRALAESGYTGVSVLNLRTNLRTDWTEKGYPVEPALKG